MEHPYKIHLGAVLTTLLLLGTYLSNQSDGDSYDVYDAHVQLWSWSHPHRNLRRKRISTLPDPKSIVLKPREFQHTNGAYRKPLIKIFYNLFINGPKDEVRVLGIFHEQLLAMDPALHNVAFVNSVGYLSPEVADRYVVGHQQEGDEGGALHALWDYCRANNNHETKVVYIHSKGSFHPKPENDLMRRFVTEGALSKECASLPDKCNVCSSRMTTHPHPHTSGNMWLARCNYVARLRDPYDLKEGRLPVVFQGGKRGTNDPCWGYERWFFEHWVHSHPSVQPCDLYPGSEYIWGYGNIPNTPFKKEIQMAPRFGFGMFGEKSKCKKNGRIVKLSITDNYIESRRAGYEQLYNMDVDELNATWYLSKFLNLTPPL